MHLTCWPDAVAGKLQELCDNATEQGYTLLTVVNVGGVASKANMMLVFNKDAVKEAEPDCEKTTKKTARKKKVDAVESEQEASKEH